MRDRLAGSCCQLLALRGAHAAAYITPHATHACHMCMFLSPRHDIRHAIIFLCRHAVLLPAHHFCRCHAAATMPQHIIIIFFSSCFSVLPPRRHRLPPCRHHRHHRHRHVFAIASCCSPLPPSSTSTDRPLPPSPSAQMECCFFCHTVTTHCHHCQATEMSFQFSYRMHKNMILLEIDTLLLPHYTHYWGFHYRIRRGGGMRVRGMGEAVISFSSSFSVCCYMALSSRVFMTDEGEHPGPPLKVLKSQCQNTHV